MNRILIAAVAMTAAFWHAQFSMAEDDRKLPNIVLCMADDQGWGDVGYYGKSPVQTPVLDEMAATGLRFDRFYAAAPVCSPTRGSVLTGRNPNRFACFAWGHPLRPQEITIAEALKKAGYATGHFGKWHLGSVRADSPVCPGNSGFDEWLSAPNFYENDPLLSHNGEGLQTTGESSQVPVDYAVKFMKEAQKQNKPFLAVIWFGSPHSPHISSEELLKLYPDQKKNIANFLGEVTGIDRAMGSLRKSLRDMNVADNTLLWYTSDNGALPQGSTGGLSGKKGTLYEGGIRVPAIIEWPNVIKKNRITERVSSTVDIYPTLLEIAGVTTDKQPHLDGESLLPLLRGEEKPRKAPLGFWVLSTKGRPMWSTKMVQAIVDEKKAGQSKPWHEVEPDPAKISEYDYGSDNMPGHSTLIDGDYKLHRVPVKNKNRFEYKLFNLKNDPQEKQDIFAQNGKRGQKMEQQLLDWQQSVLDSLAGKDY